MSDPYFDTDACVERLLKQYKKNPKLIVALDFDDTLYDFHQQGHRYDKVIELVKECQKVGFYVVIFTASQKKRYPFIIEHTHSLGIYPDGINENVIESPFGNEGKIFYNILLDDRSGLFSAYEILKLTIEKIKQN